MSTQLRPPQFIYLDLGNVIVNFDREHAVRQMAAVAGITPQATHAAVFEGGLQAKLERGEIDWAGFHDAFSRATGSTSAPDRLADAASDMFSLNVAMLPVIAAIERAGIPTGILSNTCAPHWDHLLAKRYAVMPGRFSRLVLSHEVGALKPDPGLYETAARIAGVAPEAIFFTDDVAEHVVAARAAGWDAEVFVTAVGLADALERRGVNLGL
jgi:putative hydrolase of the HAD superfamily